MGLRAGSSPVEIAAVTLLPEAAASAPRMRRLPPGPCILLGFVAALELLSRLSLGLPDPVAPTLIAVVFVCFTWGFRQGLASAVVAWAYFAWALPGDPRRLAALAVLTPVVVGLAGLLHRSRLRTSERLRRSEERYALAARGANDGLWDWDLARDRVFYSPRWKSMLGYSEGEIGESPDEWFKRVHPEDLQSVKQALRLHLDGQAPHFESEHRIRDKERGYRWVLTRGLAVRNRNGSATRMAGSQTDITQRKLAEETLVHDALHDALTQLPNRTLFVDRLSQRLRAAVRNPERPYAVLFLDLDRFKVVNDSLGHSAGDELLKEVAQRLQASVRPADTVARLGGDEFAVLLTEIAEGTQALVVADRIQEALRRPFLLQGQEIVTTASIGIALSETRYAKPEDVLRDADIAMYRSKGQGGGRHTIFDGAMHDRAVSLLQTESDLRHALERREFVLHFQPVVSLADGRITGFETLIRWNHPKRGFVPPLEFIGIAEDSGLILPLDRWVVDEACRQLAEWRARWPDAAGLTVGVNISGRHFSQSDLVEHIEKALQRNGLEGPSLAVEITEGVLIQNTVAADEILGRLRALGVKIYLDDFGTGYSSLSYLHHFPIDVVKIDRSFVQRLGPGGDGQPVVRAIAVLAHSLGMKVIAEGVETENQRAGLRVLSCECGQGYLFSKPLPPDAAAMLILQGHFPTREQAQRN